jgi:FAD/FMN-containing dehydrogenase
MAGYGCLTGKHGITLDNIVSVEMVLASGEIDHVSKHKNKGLSWAVRGAGACFGVVITFVFQAYTQDHMVWHGNLILPRSSFGATIEVANKVLEKGNEGVAAMSVLWGKAPGQAHLRLVVIS